MDLLNVDGFTVLQYAFNQGKLNICYLLIQEGANVSKGIEIMQEALLSDEIDTCKILISKGEVSPIEYE